MADGDGVIVVPARDIAEDVARYAHEEHNRDKKRRLAHYKNIGMGPDDTVQ